MIDPHKRNIWPDNQQLLFSRHFPSSCSNFLCMLGPMLTVFLFMLFMCDSLWENPNIQLPSSEFFIIYPCNWLVLLKPDIWWFSPQGIWRTRNIIGGAIHRHVGCSKGEKFTWSSFGGKDISLMGSKLCWSRLGDLEFEPSKLISSS